MSWHELLVRGITLPDDSRVGSGRDGSDGGTLSTANGNKSNSLSKLGATFAPVAIYLGLCLTCFLLLRPRSRRVYAPRTIPGLRYPENPTPELPSGLFNWFIPFLKIPDTYILNNGSLDAYFFLRYLKVLRNISLVGCCIVWPILLPVHGTGGHDLGQLEQLTIGNITSGSSRLWAHAVVAWLFFGFVLFTVVRECIYFVNLRQAYLSSPYYADRLSSKTLLLLCIPKPYRDEARLRKLYGDSAKRIFIPRTSKDLANLVKEREQTAMRLEKAEIALIKKANVARNKYLRKHPQAINAFNQIPKQATETSSHNDVTTLDSGETVQQSNGPLEVTLPGSQLEVDIENQAGYSSVEGGTKQVNLEEEEEIKAEDLDYVHPYGLRPNLPDVRGSVAAQWIPAEARPHHRPIGNFGRRVDTIRWTRMRLKELNLQIYKLRRQIKRGDAEPLPAAFIEFDTQEAAHAAQQVVVHHLPLQMAPGLLGIRPDEVIWESLRMKWWERIIRRLLILSGITAAIIFWSIPSALIGIVSQVDFLTEKVPFLHWINKLPDFIIGIISGLLPPFALSVLMALVPILLRICAAQAGIPSLIIGELFTQNAYFAFQVVQVFLVTTITSAASSALESIIQNPLGIQSLLAQNLPKASNFYLSYILIQCLASGGTQLLQVFSVIRHHIVAKTSDIPRRRFETWRKLRPARWGGIFPVFTNMGVIALSYACIAPLILIFCAGGMAFMGLVWKYNLIYVFDTTTDSKGLFYPRALQQLIIGLYLAEICLIGLLILNHAFGPMGFVITLLLLTGLVHFLLRDAISRLMWSLPQTLAVEEQIQEEEKAKLADHNDGEAPGNDAGGAAASYFDVEQAFGDEEIEIEEIDEDDHHVVSNRALEGASSIRLAMTAWIKSAAIAKVKEEMERSGLNAMLDRVFAFAKSGDGEGPPGFLARWLHPEEHEDFVALRKMIPTEDRPPISYTDGDKYATYQPPELWMPKPILWIPRDEARVSRQEVAHTRLSTPISDLGATLNEKGRISVDLDAAPFEEHRMLL
ncbi:uncharacterized protein TRIVIDRAFT_219740 [Trichoderma virens Gv29-8]|uniref:DUF221-domain-containing protein n=1 Tax=Hypocrea virens (strain Gv29-8 / FGSC 10586) TaxID=413071 RepID=G9MLQ7_HYPVG|nr:uncharacterized protein TRIVIDRAFT_219740 [Trichoderma virens Gv29-8]EHK24284.1 hypothetical protein TRIVIDRAFT_219740 [Trichoderma virens Gv29-8]